MSEPKFSDNEWEKLIAGKSVSKYNDTWIVCDKCLNLIKTTGFLRKLFGGKHLCIPDVCK